MEYIYTFYSSGDLSKNAKRSKEGVIKDSFVGASPWGRRPLPPPEAAASSDPHHVENLHKGYLGKNPWTFLSPNTSPTI